MLILHSVFYDNRLWLWGEVSRDLKKISPPARKRVRLCAPVMAYAATLPDLFSASEHVLGYRLKQNEATSLVAWLPTANGEPLPSSFLLLAADALSLTMSEPATLAPWYVPAVPLAPRDIVAWLCGCAGRQVIVPGVIVGPDVAFWVTAMRFAASLAASGQLSPGLRLNGKATAVWEPVIIAHDVAKMSALVNTMPAVARALNQSESDTPDIAAGDVLTGFVTLIADLLMRYPAPERDAGVTASHKRQKQSVIRVEHPCSQPATAQDAWLAALASETGELSGVTPDDARELAAQIQTWRRAALITAQAPFRLCLRLEEPAEQTVPADNDATDEPAETAVATSDNWYVRYLVQACDDASLLVPLPDVFQARGGKANLWKRRGFPLREYLLAALGIVARLCPETEESLKVAAPAGYACDATGAYRFLQESACTLTQAGIAVLLPAWWTKPQARPRVAARVRAQSPRMRSKGKLSLDAVVEFDWQLALGDMVLSAAELEQLVRLKSPLVRLRGQWVHADVGELAAAMRLWQRRQDGKTKVRDLLHMALGASKQSLPIPASEVEADGWVGDMLAQLKGEKAWQELSSPKNFSGSLRPYQVRGYSWLKFLSEWGLGACLADSMGLGKTIQALALIQHNREAGERRPVLLICPTSVIGNWQREAARFTPELPVLVHHGAQRKKGAVLDMAAQKHAIVISSYALLARDLAAFREISWAGVVLDEAQNIKNTETKQAKAARTLESDYRIALTGTPVENHVGELWSLMEFLNPGMLGGQQEFNRNFFLPIQTTRDNEAADRLKKLTAPFILRRLKTDKNIISDLPDKTEMKVYCPLTKEQASLYQTVVTELTGKLDEVEGIQRKGIILAALTKLKQVCNHPAHFLKDNSALAGRSGKLARLCELIEEILDGDECMLIFSQFREMGELLRRHLQETFGQEVLFLHGGVARAQRDQMIERFQQEGEGPKLFVLSLKAGGTGLNLTRASHVVHFDRWWNPAVEDQATDRTFRIGQTRNVLVHKFICTGTVEEKIEEMIEAKKEVTASVVGSGEAWLTELSSASLRQIFALRPEAVADRA
jgi:SNF2 family DNA or RNA helicase